MTRKGEAWVKFAATRVVGLAVDTFILALAYAGAIALRFDFHIPRWGWRATAYSFVTVAAAQIAAMVAFGCYRISWRRLTIRSLPCYVLASGAACVALTLLRYLTPLDEFLHVRPPYTVT